MERVRGMRQLWATPDDRELWFRGESKQHVTFLRPELYRPRKTTTGKDQPLKNISELLKIENDLYEEFQRCAVQLRPEKPAEEDWDWDSYFLMQHHGAATRLLDWSDGCLMVRHFALRNKLRDDLSDAVVYLLEPTQLVKQIEDLSESKYAEKRWRSYARKHPSYELSEEDSERAYLPAAEEDLKELGLPTVPLLLDFPHITRRVAAQRSRFIVFGTDPTWLAKELQRRESLIKSILIDGASSYELRCELRESGVTESVIFPDLDGLGRELKQVWEDRK